MNLVISPSASISGELEAPPSKLYTQISTAIAILADGKSTIESPLRVLDTTVMLRAAESLGATVKRSQDRWSIWGLGGKITTDKNVVDAKNSGTAIGLLTGIATLSRTSIVLNGDAQLRSRPMPTLLKALRGLGADVCSIRPDDSPPFLAFGGGLSGGRAKLKDLRVRFLPAVLIAAPYARRKVELILREKVPEPVKEIMKAAGVKLAESRNRISVPKQPYHSFSYQVPREIAGAAPFLVAAGLSGSKIKITNLKRISERDEVFLRYLKSFGFKVQISKNVVYAEGRKKLKAARLDLSSCPELLPLLAVVACEAGGKTLLYNAEDARAMKSDRISAIANELRRMKAKLLERNDGLLIRGPTKLKGCEVDGHGDYAITSALVVAALSAENNTTIKNGFDSLGYNFSRFISTFQNLGAEISLSGSTA
jgi:3-phosphoshikimate 1-carboxyvinyltransferase